MGFLQIVARTYMWRWNSTQPNKIGHTKDWFINVKELNLHLNGYVWFGSPVKYIRSYSWDFTHYHWRIYSSNVSCDNFLVSSRCYSVCGKQHSITNPLWLTSSKTAQTHWRSMIGWPAYSRSVIRICFHWFDAYVLEPKRLTSACCWRGWKNRYNVYGW